LVLAPVEPPGVRPESLGALPRARTGIHLREALLVVQHVLERRLLGDAAPGVPGRRPEADRSLHRAARVAGRARGEAGPLPALRLLGAPGGNPLQPLDRARGGPGDRTLSSRTDAGVPAASRLRPPAF